MPSPWSTPDSDEIGGLMAAATASANNVYPAAIKKLRSEAGRGMLLDSTMMIYLGMKAFLLVSLVGVLMKTDALRDQTLGLSLIYTVGLAFLSMIFLVGPNMEAIGPEGWKNWLMWLGATYVVSLVYFKSLVWFEESRLFWGVLALGAVLVWF